MSAQPLEIRMARLEGAYEQIAERLTGLEQRMDSRLLEIGKKIDANLRTTITCMLGQTAVIIGAMAALYLHR